MPSNTNKDIKSQGRTHSPLYTEGGEVEHGADDGEGLRVVSHLAEGRPELPAEREQLPHLQCDMCGYGMLAGAHDDLQGVPKKFSMFERPMVRNEKLQCPSERG